MYEQAYRVRGKSVHNRVRGRNRFNIIYLSVRMNLLLIGIAIGALASELFTWMLEDLKAAQQRRDDRFVHRIVKEISEKIALK